ncbi:TPA: restriction endonuclease subunit S [Vibrio vulnificus]|nr:restriction endonuclease subunit S [Vibrio vulnificus]
MASNWPRVRVSDVCELIVDCVNKTAPVSPVPTPYKMIRTPNIKNGRVSTDDCRCVDADTFAKWTRRATVERNDVLLTREAPLGEVGIVNSSEQLFLGQRIMQYRADQSKLDPHFLLYSFLSPDLQHQFSMHEGSGSVVSHIRVGDCSKFELNLPPLAMQKRISEILRNLDNRITLNHQINQTLELMAQTLFKSWFVDFDPVMDNALDAGNPIPDELQHRAEARKAVRESEDFKPLPDDVRQLFPDAFEESELGWVPKGWAVKTCEEISTRIGMGPFGSNIKVSTFVDSGIPVISGTHLKSVLLNDHSYNFITEDHAQKLKNSAVYRGDIVFTHAGNIGQVALIPDESDYESYMISQRQFYLRPDSSQVKSSYIVHYFHSHLGQHKLLSNASQTGVPSIARPSSHLKGIALVIPSNEVQESFDGLVTRWNEKTMRTRNNIDLLTKLRDTLLPKLISGELCLDDVEAAVEQETVSA